MNTINVGIADDHPIILRGVSSYLENSHDITVRFAVDQIDQLLESLIEKPVDILLCDYEFEGDPLADGLNLLERVRRLAPHTRVVFLSSHSSAYIVSAALDAGASGFIGKRREHFANLAVAIRSVQNQTIYLPDDIREKLMFLASGESKKNLQLSTLSEREVTVARMICDGMSIGDIATRLNRSPKTVSNQKNAGMKKLGVRNDVELAKAMREVGR